MVYQGARTQRINRTLRWNNRIVQGNNEAQPLDLLENLSNILRIISKDKLEHHFVTQFYFKYT